MPTNQRRFDFVGRKARRPRSTNLQWPEIVAAEPTRYSGLLQNLAQRALHREGKLHRSEDCSLCQKGAA